jgi:peptide/nickel transport system substrate-binding protein
VEGVRRPGPAGVLVVTLALLLSGCTNRPAPSHPAATSVQATTSTTSTATTVPTNSSSLVIAPTTEARLDDNFNPFDTTSPLAQMSVPSYVYEPLVTYDDLQVNEYYPWLAESWSFSTSGQTMTFDLRPSVHWYDGSTFSAADVAYTFNLLRDDPSINDGIPIVSAVATNPTTFTLTLSQPGYAYLYDIARVPIVKSGYAAGADPATYVDRDPDGTGPYALASTADANAARVVLTARRGYWQTAEPPVHQLVFPAYPTGAALRSALVAGTVDWASSYMPDVQASFVDRDPTDNHYWFPPVDCISLQPSMVTYPTDQLVVRQAISAALDRDTLSARASGRHDPPASSTSGLVLPTDRQFLVRSDTNDISDGGDVAAAGALMRRGGYHEGPLGYWASASGQRVAFTIEDPQGTALAVFAAVAAQQLRAAGFDVTAKVVPAQQWSTDLAGGRFGSSVVPSPDGPSPYYMYQDWLDPALVVHGRAVGGNYEQLSPATEPSMARTATSELALYENSPTGSARSASAIRALADFVSHQLPVVPLVYGVAWDEFSTRHATGWPDSQDTYEPAAPVAPFAEYTVLQLQPSSP